MVKDDEIPNMSRDDQPANVAGTTNFLIWQVGFYRELLSFGFNVWACDADAVFMNDPRQFMRQYPYTEVRVWS